MEHLERHVGRARAPWARGPSARLEQRSPDAPLVGRRGLAAVDSDAPCAIIVCTATGMLSSRPRRAYLRRIGRAFELIVRPRDERVGSGATRAWTERAPWT